MILNEVQKREFEELVKPLMKWLADNCHPHCEVHVGIARATLVEGVATARTDEFVRG